MDQIRTFVDTRLAAYCGYCHGVPNTRDHIPAKVFLDEPYPENLPVVSTCASCNQGASLDEEYVACLLEAAACGTVEPGELERPKVARILTRKTALRGRLAASFRKQADGGLAIAAEQHRVNRVFEKAARGLWTFETGETTAHATASVSFAAASEVDDEAKTRFRQVAAPQLLPEVGSRMMFRVLVQEGMPYLDDPWQEVQAGRFEYAVEVFGDWGRVKMVVRDYLLAEVLLTST